ncbi:MAG: lytic transglycosylase domain-containing protein [Clostridia bacterium]|nr:lytic transglycosylase domain-containing protein [Clostridia bacterium]
MAKKRRRNRRRARAGIFAGGAGIIILFVLLLTVCILCLVGLKLTEKVATEIELRTYPLEYSDIISKYCNEYDVPKSVVFAMIKVESNFREDALSHADARGLMQLTPETFTWLAGKLGEEVSVDQLYDPETNIRYGTYYVSRLYSQFGNWENVYAAYNAGPTKVSSWLDDPVYSSNGVLTNIPYEETKNHVNKLVNVRAKYIELYFLGE